MIFSSLLFICFFLPLTFIIYYICPAKCKNLILTLASLVFYLWSGLNNTLLLITMVLFNYFIGILIVKIRRFRKLTLTIGLSGNLLVLFIFKYFNFFIGNINLLFNVSLDVQRIVLPIGISFYIFQCISYIVDVYREYTHTQSNTIFYQKNPLNMFLYIAFFPQLIAGPIVRYHDISEQLNNRSHNIEKISLGFSRFICGLAKKVILADFLGKIADNIFNLEVAYLSTLAAWLGIICYALQIFFDFSGYSDMAIGLGRIFGFDFLENFNLPYVSTSITHFWRRWHMSLSGWFRDYVYIPLGGNRYGNIYLHLAFVFLLTGIWHGAAWGYIVWGIWHGTFILIERFWKNNCKINLSVPKIIKWLYTILVVIIGWVFFRADSIFDAINYLKTMFGLQKPKIVLCEISYYLNLRNIFIICISILLSLVPIRQFIQNQISPKLYRSIASILSIFLLLICFIMIVNSTYSPFIYFQF